MNSILPTATISPSTDAALSQFTEELTAQLSANLPKIILIAVGVLFLCNLLYAILAGCMAGRKGYRGLGFFVLSLFFGMIGFLYTLGLPCYHDSIRAKRSRLKSKRYADDE